MPVASLLEPLIIAGMSIASPHPNDYPELTAELIATGREFYTCGWSLATSSNYSVVVNREPLRLLLTGSGFDKGRLTPNQFVIVDGDGKRLDDSQPKPSAETRLHTVLAKTVGAGSVLHTHSIWATVLSERHASAGVLELAGYEMIKAFAGITTHENRVRIAIVPNTQDIDALASRLEVRLQAGDPDLRHGFLMAGHGLYTWGKDIPEARRHIEACEFLFEVYARKYSTIS